MSVDDRDSLDELRAYWLKRQELDQLCASLVEALRTHRTAEAPALLTRARTVTVELATLAALVGRTPAEGTLTTALQRGLRELREQLSKELVSDPSVVVAEIAPLDGPDAEAGLPGAARRVIVESLAAQSALAVREGRLELARVYGDMLLQYGGDHSPLLLTQINLELARAATAGGNAAIARDALTQAQELLAARPDDRTTATLRARLADEEAALELELGRQALTRGNAGLAAQHLTKIPAASPYGPEAGNLLERAQTPPETPKPPVARTSRVSWGWMTLLMLAPIALTFFFGRNLLGGSASIPLSAMSPFASSTTTVIAQGSLDQTVIQTSVARALAQTQTSVAAQPLLSTSLALSVTASAAITTIVIPPGDPATTLRGRLINDQVAVYADPVDSSTVVVLLLQDSELSLCALAGDRYLVALSACGPGTPLGWVAGSNIQPLFVEPFPPALTTPLPTPLP